MDYRLVKEKIKFKDNLEKMNNDSDYKIEVFDRKTLWSMIGVSACLFVLFALVAFFIYAMLG